LFNTDNKTGNISSAKVEKSIILHPNKSRA
jgi:hypothetical protein